MRVSSIAAVMFRYPIHPSALVFHPSPISKHPSVIVFMLLLFVAKICFSPKPVLSFSDTACSLTPSNRVCQIREKFSKLAEILTEPCKKWIWKLPWSLIFPSPWYNISIVYQEGSMWVAMWLIFVGMMWLRGDTFICFYLSFVCY